MARIDEVYPRLTVDRQDAAADLSEGIIDYLHVQWMADDGQALEARCPGWQPKDQV